MRRPVSLPLPRSLESWRMFRVSRFGLPPLDPMPSTRKPNPFEAQICQAKQPNVAGRRGQQRQKRAVRKNPLEQQERFESKYSYTLGRGGADSNTREGKTSWSVDHSLSWIPARKGLQIINSRSDTRPEQSTAKTGTDTGTYRTK